MMLGLQTPAPQAPAPPAATPVAAPIRALQSQLFGLQTRVNVLNAQRVVLVERTRSDDPAVRASAEKSLLDVDLQLASAKAELAAVQTQVAQEGGGPVIAVPPPGASPTWFDKVDPDAVTAVFVITALAVLIPLSIGIARRLWRRPATPSGPPLEDKIVPRLDRLEHAVDAIAIEVERISEGQRFVARVLTERPPIIAPVSAQPASHVEGGEGKPFLALGAGPLEPIRVAERQAVKQTVTPH